jgi:hypothetical protein
LNGALPFAQSASTILKTNAKAHVHVFLRG